MSQVKVVKSVKAVDNRPYVWLLNYEGGHYPPLFADKDKAIAAWKETYEEEFSFEIENYPDCVEIEERKSGGYFASTERYGKYKFITLTKQYLRG